MPSVYFYSLNQKKVVLQARGCEGFIGFVSSVQGHKGHLYFMIQSFVRTCKFGYKNIETLADYKNQLRLHTQKLQNGDYHMDVLKIPIDFKNPPVSKKAPGEKPG